ncbi:MAG: NmrA family protein, partial [Proteobacteria bacterium]
MERERARVVVAGASGFVGRALLPLLAARFHVVALSRGAPEATPPAHVEWRACDLFSLRDTERALAGADYGVYLVHSMMPSARLTQASFADVDLVLADNFARAAQRAGLRQIVYLGGLAAEDEALSQHLESRLEVERTLASRGVPLTAVRAGLVIGAGGSSFQLLERLVRRLPVMLCPAWTATRTQPVALADVAELLAGTVGDASCAGAVLEAGGPEVMTYRAMMQRTAALLGKRRPMLPVPFFSPGLSRLWVSLVTQAPRALVAPLIQSLRHTMVASRDDLAARLGRSGAGFDDAVRAALAEQAASPAARRDATRRAFAGERRR